MELQLTCVSIGNNEHEEVFHRKTIAFEENVSFPTWNLSECYQLQVAEDLMVKKSAWKWLWENKTKYLDFNSLPDILIKIILVRRGALWIQ